ncbi:MAG TPA: ABC transporter substrate-binding protein [Firmicutes bacterium]|jgi:oligopeptide transport system substrate-binding protein|nr:ABC transporter substrate-binding protein [Bacillota bacterium]HAW70620.1 ABC transporter substrate-binding protein [Bacillota bacterium]HAZ22899.1 ABC transporter substrate-binding protein [Bacillota bacterium]HBE06094.1 ABC transporter substrate-binding protein [Bacillota bacterium]HBG43182.1 ABC transporter substrate-binding protein [Bacillota bacterium]
MYHDKVKLENAFRVGGSFRSLPFLNMKIGGNLMRRTTLVLVCLMVATALAASVFAAPAKDQTLTMNLGVAEPETLDPAKSTGVAESTILLNLHEGLTRLDKDGNPAPGIAEKWDISKDGKTYTFHLRNAKWNNGDPITAQDFEWSWKRALAPETMAEYAYQLWYIKGAQAYTEGTGKAADVAVKAINDRTLQVELNAPTGYWLSLCAFPTLLPVHPKTVEANPDKWFMSPKTYISAGPFKMTEWKHNSQLVLEKNPLYWDAKNVKLNKVVITLIDSQITELTMFETGELDYGDNPPPAEFPRLQKEKKLAISPYLGCYYYLLNVNVKPLSDVRVRHALSMAIDRTTITQITAGGQKPATAYVPFGIPDLKSGTDFRTAGGAYLKETAQVAEAKKLLADAGYADGKGFPTLSILYNTNEMHKTIAEAIQEMWKKNLGINVTLTNQEWGVYLESRNTGDYSVARAGWIGDYVDPMTFLDMWVTGGGNNDTNWGSPKYDELIKTVMNSGVQAERVKAMHAAEDILMKEMPIIPIYFYTRPYLMKPWVKDMIRLVTGHIDLKYSYIEAH